MDISQLQFRDKNPRLIKAENLEKLKNSIKDDPDFLTKRKILVNDTKDGKIVYAGNQRLRSLLALWYTEVPDEWIDIEKNIPLKLMEKRAFKDNVEYGEYDHDKLKDFDLEFLKELDLPEWELDLSELNDIDLDEEKEDSVPEPAKEAKLIEIGDIIQLWPHRIMCGDSTVKEDVDKLMDGNICELLFTSPPYSDMREYNGNKDLSIDNLVNFITEFTPYSKYQVINLWLQRKNNEVVTYWDMYIETAKANWYKFLSWNVWSRRWMWWSIANMSAMFRMEHERIFIFGKEYKNLNDTQKNESAWLHTWITNRQKDWTTKRVAPKIVKEFWRLSSVLEMCYWNSKDHPAVFPVEFPEEYIKAMTNELDNVCEPFCWSWSTLIACEKTNRVCYWMELDPVYIEVIIKRYHEYTKWARDIKVLNRDLDITPLYAQ